MSRLLHKRPAVRILAFKVEQQSCTSVVYNMWYDTMHVSFAHLMDFQQFVREQSTSNVDYHIL